MTFVSVERNMRGFSYHRDWKSITEFWEAIIYQRDNENNEIEWARCFNEQGGEVAKYRRGYRIPEEF